MFAFLPLGTSSKGSCLQAAVIAALNRAQDVSEELVLSCRRTELNQTERKKFEKILSQKKISEQILSEKKLSENILFFFLTF